MAAGSCATVACESSQGRKAAALSGTRLCAADRLAASWGDDHGELPEWTNGLAWKACEVFIGLRGFESHTLRVKKDMVPGDGADGSGSSGSDRLQQQRQWQQHHQRRGCHGCSPWSRLGWHRRSANVPVGSVVLLGDRVLAARHNERRQTGDPTAHAEVLALRDAADGAWTPGILMRHDPGNHA